MRLSITHLWSLSIYNTPYSGKHWQKAVGGTRIGQNWQPNSGSLNFRGWPTPDLLDTQIYAMSATANFSKYDMSLATQTLTKCSQASSLT
ncbi:MAG: hypothetical protein OEU84_05405, partial [Xanthomonadales bacterium]|jgi:hypothetical protein|nr:hypothetical protein [Xanthomonadales bacterium]